jgi:hypothetical protein
MEPTGSHHSSFSFSFLVLAKRKRNENDEIVARWYEVDPRFHSLLCREATPCALDVPLRRPHPKFQTQAICRTADCFFERPAISRVFPCVSYPFFSVS